MLFNHPGFQEKKITILKYKNFLERESPTLNNKSYVLNVNTLLMKRLTFCSRIILFCTGFTTFVYFFSSETDEQYAYAEEYILHPKYNAKLLQNDVAIIRLQNPVVLNDFVKLACLPAKNEYVNRGK